MIDIDDLFMDNPLGLIDIASYICAITFLVFAFKIRQKIMLPQNNILLLIGFFLFLNTGSHVPSYFPEIFPQIGEFWEHFIIDSTLFLTSIVLLFYGYTTYSDIIKSSPKTEKV